MVVNLMFILDWRLNIVFMIARFLYDEEMVITLMFILDLRLNIVFVLVRLIYEEINRLQIGMQNQLQSNMCLLKGEACLGHSYTLVAFCRLWPLTPNMNPIPGAGASQPDNVQTPQDQQALQTQLPHGQPHWSHLDPSVQQGQHVPSHLGQMDIHQGQPGLQQSMQQMQQEQMYPGSPIGRTHAFQGISMQQDQQVPSHLGQMPIQQGQPGLPQSMQLMQPGYQPPYQNMPHHQPGLMYPGSPIGTPHAFQFPHQHEQYPTHQQNMSLQGPSSSSEQPQHLNQGQQLPHIQVPEMELGQKDYLEFHQANQPGVDVDMVHLDVDTNEYMNMDVDLDVDENNGFNIHNQHDDFFKSAIVFLPRDRKNDILHVRNQRDIGCCISFAMVTLVTAAARGTYGTMIKLSEQQMCTLLGEGTSYRKASKYVKFHGLMEEESCPWIGKCRTDLPIPRLPCFVYRAGFSSVREDGYEKILQFKPIAATLYMTKSAVSWYDDGCKGIFKYPENERNEVLYLIGTKSKDVPKGHAVAVVGYGIERYGIERGQRHYFVQDSYGTSINWGYRKFDPNVILDGLYVKEVVREMIETCDSLLPSLDVFDDSIDIVM